MFVVFHRLSVMFRAFDAHGCTDKQRIAQTKRVAATLKTCIKSGKREFSVQKSRLIVKISDKRIKMNGKDVKNGVKFYAKFSYSVWESCLQKISATGKVIGTEIKSMIYIRYQGRYITQKRA